MSKKLTVQDKILLFLYDNDPIEYGTPFIACNISQDGIASALNLTRPQISIELKKLEDKHYIRKWKSRINGQKRKRWVYIINFSGREYCENQLR